MAYWPKAQARYDAANTRSIGLKLNYKTDADILDAIKDADSMQGRIKQLVRAGLAAEAAGDRNDA